MKVVMVDDSEEDRELFRHLLQKAYGPELQFFEATTGHEGLEVCRTAAPDCVLLDYSLPDITGLEFLIRLRSEVPADFPVFAVLMLTGISSGDVALAAMKAGAQDFLVKDNLTAEKLSSAIDATQKAVLIRSLKAERDQLARSLAEKDILLKEVHHRVKNNLQVIASLLRLQANNCAEDIAGVLRESQHRVEAMALIHEQLYQTDDLRDVDLAQHADLLIASLFDSYGVDASRISRRVAIEPLRLGVDRAISAGLILNELISNALKHAFPNGRRGTISIEGGVHNGNVVLSVSDDGVGVPAEADRKMLKSLGLEIVKILSRQLKGACELDRSHGTTFRFSFPER